MKRLVAILLSLAMMLSLVACGGNTSTERTEEPAEKTEEPAKTDAPASSGDAAEPIKVGVYMPMTGVQAGLGLCQIEGIQQAIDIANANGGIDGRMVELITYDDAATTEGATKAATRLIEEDGVQIIVGDFLSANILAVSALTEEAKVLHVGAGTGSSWTNIGLEYTYRALPVGTLPILTMTEEMVDMGIKSFALISVESEYGQAGRGDILAATEKAGIEVKADLTYQTADTDYTGIITKAMASGADTIVLYGVFTELGMLVKQLRQNGYEDLIFTAEGVTASELFTVSGDASNGVVGAGTYFIPATPDGAPSDIVREQLEIYYEANGEMPYGDTFCRGYDQMSLVLEALRNCDDPDSGESIMEAFRAISGLELMSGTFDFTAGTGDGLTGKSKYMILDCAIQVYDKAALEAWRG